MKANHLHNWAAMPDWITTSEAAQVSGYHPEYIRKLARQGRIGAEKKGRDWWIDRDRLREYVDLASQLGAQKHAGMGLTE